MTRVSEDLRQRVAERANGLCEYCQASQDIVVDLEIDHIIPQTAQGKTTLDNLCLCCRGCNAFKRDFQMAVDPETQETVRLFNPRIDNWHSHFRWSEDSTHLDGLTDIGRATIAKLRLNRERNVAARKRWVEAGLHPPLKNS